MLPKGQKGWEAMWHFIQPSNAIPSDRDLMLAVADERGVLPLGFPCRWRDGRWVEAKSGRVVQLAPTHWRDWFLG